MLNADVRVNGHAVRRGPFSARDWFGVSRSVVRGAGDKRLSLIAAGIAFFAMLALFPAIAAVIAVFGYISDPTAIRETLTIAEPVLPAPVHALLSQQIEALLSAGRSTLGAASVAGVLLAIWSARAGVSAMIGGLGLIGHEKAPRNFFWGLLVAYLLTMMLIAVSLVALASVVVIPAILAFFPLGGWNGAVLDLLRWAIALASVAIGIGTLYRYGPAPSGDRAPVITYGNLLASLLWVAVSAAFSTYLSNFGSYNQIYGSLGAVIALLMWFYLSAFVVLLGAELNAVIEARGASAIRATDPETLVPGGDLAREMEGERPH